MVYICRYLVLVVREMVVFSVGKIWGGIDWGEVGRLKFGFEMFFRNLWKFVK